MPKQSMAIAVERKNQHGGIQRLHSVQSPSKSKTAFSPKVFRAQTHPIGSSNDQSAFTPISPLSPPTHAIVHPRPNLLQYYSVPPSARHEKNDPSAIMIPKPQSSSLRRKGSDHNSRSNHNSNHNNHSNSNSNSASSSYRVINISRTSPPRYNIN